LLPDIQQRLKQSLIVSVRVLSVILMAAQRADIFEQSLVTNGSFY
jgi:hypothetical protein